MTRTMGAALIVAMLTGCTGADRPVSSAAPQAASLAAERALAGRIAGEPQACITSRDADRSVQLENGVAYGPTRGVLYVQRFSGQCDNRLLRDGYLVTRSTMTRLCRGDIAEVVDRTSQFPIGSCVYDDFVPYRKTR